MAACVVFRADAGPDIGGGHMMRSMALASAFLEEGWRCVLATAADSTVEGLVPDLVHVVSLPNPEDELETLVDQLPERVDLAIIDHYGLDKSYERSMRQLAHHVAVLADGPDREHDCDLLLDSAFGASLQRYTGNVPAHAVVLAGPDYAPIRTEFIESRRKRLAAVQKPSTVLLTMGLSDPRNLTESLLLPLCDVAGPANVLVVVGAQAPHRKRIADLVKNLVPEVRLVIGARDIWTLMEEADVAVSAAGSTALEMCCVGLPMVLVVSADNQRLAARGLGDFGAAVVVGDAVGDYSTRAADAVGNLLKEHSVRREMGHKGRQLVDGLGSRRAFQVLASLGTH